jgi:hypothetical protein
MDGRSLMVFLDVLQFIKKYRQDGLSALGGFASGRQQRLQVLLKIAVVRQSLLRLEIQAHSNIVIRDPKRRGKTGESSKRPLSQVFGFLNTGKTEERAPQFRL